MNDQTDWKELMKFLNLHELAEPLKSISAKKPDDIDLFKMLHSPKISQPKNALKELSLMGLPIDSKRYWWVKYPNRACKEIDLMFNNTNSSLKRTERKLVWDEVIKNNFKTQFYISIETQDYPHKMPEAYIRHSEIRYKKSKHMFPGGRLCLMHPRRYNSNISVLEIRNLTCAWCWAVEVYTYTGTWPTAEAD